MWAKSIYTIAGSREEAYDGDNALAMSKNVYSPLGVFLDTEGNMYIAE